MLSPITGIFKPMFEHKLKIKKSKWVRFKGSKITDTIEMSGYGECKDTRSEVERNCEPLKLSENPEYENILIRESRKNIIDFKEWVQAYITFDFEGREVKSEVYYISVSGAKQKKSYVSKF